MKELLTPFRRVYRALVWFANSPRTLFISYLLMILVAGVIYGQVEQKSPGDAIWWAVVTASTVGYGDISPVSWPGRVLAALLISTMVLLVIPLITAHFASKLIVDRDAFEHEEQERLKTDLRVVRLMLEEMATRAGISVSTGDVTSADSAGPPEAPSGRPGRHPPHQ